mmetsp:Transcript_22126/g.22300  ORF Transcript_22126/g.22300 Transcript_22126/m.22300 type:complete len:85 (+) Transcript_22126:175-429(+)
MFIKCLLFLVICLPNLTSFIVDSEDAALGNDTRRVLRVMKKLKVDNVKDFKGKGYRAKTTASRLKRLISSIEQDNPIPNSFKLQ